MLRCTFSHTIDIASKKTLYLSLVRSQLIYCSPLWHPYLICDISSLERIQRRATKFILNDNVSDYKTHLVKLNILPLMYYVTYSFLSNHCTIQQIMSTSTTMSVFFTILLDLPPTTSSSITTLHPTSKATFISTVCQENLI